MAASQAALLARYETVRGARPNYPVRLHQYQVPGNACTMKQYVLIVANSLTNYTAKAMSALTYYCNI